MIKALFFDIDGTLVPYGTGRIPAEVVEALQRLRNHDIKIFIASGRHINWINNLGEMKFDGYVTANGALCLEADKKSIISSTLIPDEDIIRLNNFSAQSDIPIVVVPEKEKIFISRMDESVEIVANHLKLPPVPVKPVSEALGIPVVQLMAFGSETERRESGLFSDILLNCEPTSWNNYFCDIIPKGSDKGVGILKMARHFNLKVDEIAAFGDGSNDIPMLKMAGTGVAMGDSDKAVIEAADFVTSPANDGGIINALQSLIPNF